MYDEESGVFITPKFAVKLTRTEQKIANYLFKHKNELISKEEITNAVYGEYTPKKYNRVTHFAQTIYRKTKGHIIIAKVQGAGLVLINHRKEN